MKNIVSYLIHREYRKETNFRLDCRIIRSLVCKKDVKFRKVWEHHTSHSVAYECGKLYFENYRKCMTLYGHNGFPQSLYQLPACRTHEKIEDCLLVQVSTERLLPGVHGNKNSLVALTANNHLLRYNIDTGELLQDIYLSHRVKFKHLSWDTAGYTFTVKSTHQHHTNHTSGSTVLMMLMLFTVFPLKCSAVFEITKTVFGRDIVDAMLSQGVLIVLHQRGLLKFYSSENIINQGKLFDLVVGQPSPLESHTGAVIGKPPLGMPINVKITECPDVLFEVKCSEHKLCIGGVPWHYIITPVGSHGIFRVHTLATKSLVENGALDLGTVSVEPDKCYFHADDSGRILHVGGTQVRILKFESDENAHFKEPAFKLVEHCKILPFAGENGSKFSPSNYTSSGRQVKKKIYKESVDMYDEEAKQVQSVDYEEDLDLLVVTCVSQSGDHYQARVCLYDNQSGDKLQEIVLTDPWKEFSDHTVLMDMDSVIHLVKGPSRKFEVYIYRLERSSEEVTHRSGARAKDTASQPATHSTEQSTGVRNRRSVRSNSSIR